MQRWLAVVALVWGVRAEAKVRIHVPTVSDRCPSGSSWDKVTTCLHAFGDITVLASTKTTRVVHVAKTAGDEVRDAGTYLYVATGGKWLLGGMHNEAGELLTFDTVMLGEHLGYRLDFASVSPTNITLEDQTTVPAPLAMMATTTSVYCAGTSVACAEAITSCDIFVRGKAYRTFRGVVRIHAGELDIIGDRTQAGDCAPEPTVTLPWPP